MGDNNSSLIKKIERLRKSCETLEFENNVFEQYYQREVGNTAMSSQGGKKERDASKKSSESKVKNVIVKPPSDDELNQVIEKLKEIEAQSLLKDLSEVVNSLIEKKNEKEKDSSLPGKPVSSTVINFNISPRSLNRLSNENKADLVMAEIDEIEHEISWQKECTQKTINNGKAMLEFLDQKYKDHLKSQAEFEREARNSIH